MRIRYVVIPHPDDEMAVWSMVAGQRSHYLVFIVLARGERSSSCSGGGLEPALGERVPQPQPFAGPGSAVCGEERVDSFHAFLDGMAATDPHLDVISRHESRAGAVEPGDETPVPTATYELSIGPHTARLVFDLGDRDTTVGEVTWAIQTARRIRAELPVQAEDDIVGSTYENPAGDAWFPYAHPEQHALAVALRTRRMGVPGPQWGRTWPGDPGRSARFATDPATFAAATAVDPGPVDPDANPGARRTGVFQRAYGWIAFAGRYWWAEEEPVHSFFSRQEDYWRATP